LLCRRGETLIQAPGALLRERSIQLLTGCAAADILRSQRPDQVRKLTLAAMTAAVTSGLMSGPAYRQGRGTDPLVHAAVSVEFEQRDRAERRGDVGSEW
jgi:hypothetical protein